MPCVGITPVGSQRTALDSRLICGKHGRKRRRLPPRSGALGGRLPGRGLSMNPGRGLTLAYVSSGWTDARASVSLSIPGSPGEAPGQVCPRVRSGPYMRSGSLGRVSRSPGRSGSPRSGVRVPGSCQGPQVRSGSLGQVSGSLGQIRVPRSDQDPWVRSTSPGQVCIPGSGVWVLGQVRVPGSGVWVPRSVPGQGSLGQV